MSLLIKRAAGQNGDQAPAAAAPKPDGRTMLNYYTFIDLYVHESSSRPSMARGLRLIDGSFAPLDRSMAAIPDVLQKDVRALYEAISAKWLQTDRRREFQIAWRGQYYRCSLLAPPGVTWEGRGADTDIEVDWVVRHVKSAAPSFDDLKTPNWLRHEIEGCRNLRGLILIGGPFASGKSTLSACAFDYWVSRSHDVGIALEDPPEIPLAKVTRNRGIVYQFDLTDRSVHEAVRNARRMSPRYVFLGEIRSADVAQELLSMSVSGPLAVCTIHASDPVNAIASLFRFASDAMSEDAARDMIASCLLRVFYQDITRGVSRTRVAQIDGEEGHLIRSSIRTGQFRSLDEIFRRQEIKRQQALAAARSAPNAGIRGP